jgi:hypothetical protein
VEQRYRLTDDGQPAGHARSEELVEADGRVLSFAAELGTPRPDVSLSGELRVDLALRLRRLDVRSGARQLGLDLDDAAELEVAGAPALLGLTARRLQARGLRPGMRRDVDVVRVDRDLDVRRGRARYTWVSGQAWRYEGNREVAWLAIRPDDGVVRSIEAAAELEE